MVAPIRGSLLSILLYISAATQSGETPSHNSTGSPLSLYSTGECPTSPKPLCSDPNCQGAIWVHPMQYQCQVTTAFQMSGRDVTLAGCRCCPNPISIECLEYNCRAPPGTRQCASEELEGCTCLTIEDRLEEMQRDEEAGNYPLPVEREENELLFEEDDDDEFIDNHGTYTIGVTGARTARPTLIFRQQQFLPAIDADIFTSF